MALYEIESLPPRLRRHVHRLRLTILQRHQTAQKENQHQRPRRTILRATLRRRTRMPAEPSPLPMHHRSLHPRLVQHDPNILGINTNGTSHKISQFADDTTLIAKPPDLPHMQTHLNTWCEATGMKENMNKREGLLLGRMRRFVLNAPKNIVPNWTPDGTPIRALGVPMGNRLDEEDWWHKRYRLVKARIAAWKSLAHLSITGRKHATSSSKQSPIPAIRLAPILALLPHHARKHPRRTRRRLLQHPLGTTARNLLERRRRVRQIKSIHTVSPKPRRERLDFK